MTTDSSILAWKIPWTEESGYSLWSHIQLGVHACTHTHKKTHETLTINSSTN